PRGGSGRSRGEGATRGAQAPDSSAPLGFCVSVATPDEALDAARLPEPALTEEHVRKAAFRFARLFRSLPDFAATPAGRMRPLLERWYEQNKHHLGGVAFDDVRASFGRAWARVNRPAGTADIENAWRLAQGMDPPPPGAGGYGEKVRLLAALCWQ